MVRVEERRSAMTAWILRSAVAGSAPGSSRPSTRIRGLWRIRNHHVKNLGSTA